MKNLTIAFLTVSLLTGCVTLINFKKHPLSGVGKQQNKIVVISGPTELLDDLFTTVIKNDKELCRTYGFLNSCKNNRACCCKKSYE